MDTLISSFPHSIQILFNASSLRYRVFLGSQHIWKFSLNKLYRKIPNLGVIYFNNWHAYGHSFFAEIYSRSGKF
jgi:hypothetical protein